jgi:histidyl-tRNA synthetase
MALSTQPYKGARDFYPEDKRVQTYMFSVMRRAVERFGYEAYDAPVLEPIELYLAKTGEEIVTNETYAFEDRGDRQVALRPEMTPTVSRMVAARRQELAMPLRLFNIGCRWRYERPQRGRYREFFQLDVDIFGVEGIEAEHELIMIADNIMRAFGASRESYSIRLNSRKLMDYVLKTYLGLDDVQSHTMSKLIDRMHKIEHAEFVAQVDALCTPLQREAGVVEKLLGFLKAKRLQDIPAELKENSAVQELDVLLEMLRQVGVSNAHFDATLMRGFDYYTGVVFEVFDNHPENNRSMFGGGRYDGLVGLFGVEPTPTVGFAMGDVTMLNFLEGHDLLPDLRPETDVYVVLIGDIYAKAQRMVSELREIGLNVALDPTGRKPDKQIKAAVKKGIHYAIFIGEKELSEQQYEVRNLITGQSERHGISRIVSIIKDYRKANEAEA